MSTNMGREQTLLLVDDTPSALEALEGVLIGQGFRLVLAENGPDALSKASEIKPDLILLDVMMPGMDGFEVCRRLRESEELAEIPIIMVTALDDRDSRIKGVEAGADDFITKPFDRVELRARVRTITRLNRYRKLLGERMKVDQIVRLSPDGILVIDEDGTIHLVNPAVCELLGVEENALLTRPLWDFVQADQLPDYRRFLGEVVAKKTRSVQKEGVFIRTDGTQFPVEVAAGFCVWDDRASCELIIRDVTQRKRLEAELQRTQRLEAMGRTASAVAHDFGNYLMAISVNAEMLQQDLKKDSEPYISASEILAVTRQARGLTQQLLAFAREQKSEPRVVDLNAVVAGIEPMLKRLLGKGIVLEIPPASGEARVKVDKTQLEQVLMNLAVNARDAMSDKGTLTIGVESTVDGQGDPDIESAPYVGIKVSDTGSGMDEETRARIFEPFFTTKEEGKGTGLGLSTVYGIVKQNGGIVRVDSELGRGTTFVVLLPRAP